MLYVKSFFFGLLASFFYHLFVKSFAIALLKIIVAVHIRFIELKTHMCILLFNFFLKDTLFKMTPICTFGSSVNDKPALRQRWSLTVLIGTDSHRFHQLYCNTRVGVAWPCGV